MLIRRIFILFRGHLCKMILKNQYFLQNTYQFIIISLSAISLSRECLYRCAYSLVSGWLELDVYARNYFVARNWQNFSEFLSIGKY